jgi:hypothetical protein
VQALEVAAGPDRGARACSTAAAAVERSSSTLGADRCPFLSREDVPLAVELRDGDPVSELSQAGEAATSGAVVAIGV